MKKYTKILLTFSFLGSCLINTAMASFHSDENFSSVDEQSDEAMAFEAMLLDNTDLSDFSDEDDEMTDTTPSDVLKNYFPEPPKDILLGHVEAAQKKIVETYQGQDTEDTDHSGDISKLSLKYLNDLSNYLRGGQIENQGLSTVLPDELFFKVGKLFYHGSSFEQSPDIALLFFQAGLYNHPNSYNLCYHLGQFYHYGLGGAPQQKDWAEDFYTESIKIVESEDIEGYSHFYFQLGKLYQSQNREEEAKNAFGRGIHHFSGAEQRTFSSEEIINVAEAYYNGDGVSPNMKEAR